MSFLVCLGIAWNVILLANFLIRSKAIIDYSTRSVMFPKGASHPVGSINEPAESKFHHLFQIKNLTIYARDWLTLQNVIKLVYWEGSKIGWTSVIKYTIDTGSDRSI